MEILKILREQCGLKQKDLAKKINMQPTTYNQYETGVREPNIQQLTKIANFYNCSIDYLVGREELKQEKKQPAQIELAVEEDLSEGQKECLKLIKKLNDKQLKYTKIYLQTLLEEEVEEKTRKIKKD